MKRADKNKRIRGLCNAVMLCYAALALLAGLAHTLLRPKDVNLYENRPGQHRRAADRVRLAGRVVSGRDGGCAQ